MLNDYEAKGQIYLALGYTDLRKGIDGLCSLVQEHYGKELRTHDLFFILWPAEKSSVWIFKRKSDLPEAIKSGPTL